MKISLPKNYVPDRNSLRKKRSIKATGCQEFFHYAFVSEIFSSQEFAPFFIKEEWLCLGNRVNSSEFGPCFEFILENPVTSNWVKAAAATYTWSPAIGGESRITCVYDFITGNFTCL